MDENIYLVEHFEPSYHGGEWQQLSQIEPTDDERINPDAVDNVGNWSDVEAQIEQDGGGLFRLVLEPSDGDRQVSEQVTIGDPDPASILAARGLDRWPDEPLTTADLGR